MPTEASPTSHARPEPLSRHELDALARLLAERAGSHPRRGGAPPPGEVDRGPRADDGGRATLRAHPLLAVGAARPADPTPGPKAIDLYLRPLGDDDRGEGDPVAGLLGWRPPPEWQAVGVVGRGTALPSTRPDRPGRDPSTGTGTGTGTGQDAERVVATSFAHLLTRDGTSASVAFVAGHRWPPDGSTGQPHGEGRIPDLCRRALGLPTRAEPSSSARLHALRWLDAVAVAALRAPGKLTWPEVLRCHPAIGEAPPGPDLADTRAIGPIELAVRAARHAADWPWERSRRACAERRLTIEGLTPEHAAWMDAGVFARWALATFPPPAELAGLAGHLLPGTVGARLRAVLSVSGVLGPEAGDRADLGMAV